MPHVIIIGNGISGITAAREIRKKSDFKITVISSESDYFYSRTALMYVYMGHMKFEHIKPYEDWFWEKNDIELLKGYVTGLDTKFRKIRLDGGKELKFDILIIAIGSRSRMPGWEGQDLRGVQGLYSLQDLESMETNTKGIQKGVITGGGLIGVEMAEMMHSRGIEVTMLIMESGYWRNVLPQEESEMITRHLRKHGIEVLLNTELDKISGDKNNQVTGVHTKDGKKIDCQFLGITVGVEPNVEFLRETDLEINRGILVDKFLKTNIQDIYAIGDCSEQRDPLEGRRSIEPVWYTGRMMGEVIAETICVNPLEYNPGVWFNSAKFFDIEYQTYGMVPPDIPSGYGSFYWQHESEEKCMRLVYKKDSMILTGIHVFGIRLRHEVCDRWIKDSFTLFQALENLDSANFDPEFFKRYEHEIINSFNQLDLEKKLEVPEKKGLFERLLK